MKEKQLSQLKMLFPLSHEILTRTKNLEIFLASDQPCVGKPSYILYIIDLAFDMKFRLHNSMSFFLICVHGSVGKIVNDLVHVPVAFCNKAN